jgi:hypothetical protein
MALEPTAIEEVRSIRMVRVLEHVLLHVTLYRELSLGEYEGLPVGGAK